MTLPSVFNRNGVWYARYKDGSGRRVRESTPYTTRDAALKYATEMHRRGHRARVGLEVEHANPEGLTLKQAAQWWIDHKLKERSRAKVQPTVVKHIRDHKIGRLRLEQVTTGIIAQHLDAVAESTSPANANHVLSYISGIFTQMMRIGKWHGVHPTSRKIQKFTLEDAEANPWPAYCVPLIVANMPTPGWIVAASLATEAMLRRSEIERLRKSDLNFRERIITLKGTKSGAERRVAMTERLVAVLREHAGDALVAAAGWAKSAEIVRRAAARAGIHEDIYREHNFHDLRDTAASQLIECGAREGVVEFMGWGKRKSSMMRARYLKYPNSRLREEIDKLTWPTGEAEVLEFKKEKA